MTPDLADFFARTNPWHRDVQRLPQLARHHLPRTWLPRGAAEPLRTALRDPSRAHLVVGPRQSGKGSLVWTILTGRREPLLHIPCGNLLIREWARDPALAAADIARWLPVGGRIFLDEAQALDDAVPFIQGLLDARLDRPIVVTASAGFDLLSKTPGSLDARATWHRLWPLGLGELAAAAPGEPPALLTLRRRRALEGMLLFGSYPEAWTGQDPQVVLGDLVEAFVLRDATDRFDIAHPAALRRLLGLAAAQVGQVVNYTEWSRVLGIAATTVVDYLALLEQTHILRLPRPFVGGRRAELTRQPKVFFVDNGLRNMLGGGFSPLERRTDLGPLLENVVFSELLKRFGQPDDIRCWRTRNGAEVDFVLEPAPGRLIGVEVKATHEARPQLPRAARSFITAYGPEQLWMVTRGPAWDDQLGATRLRGVPIEALPDVLAAL